MKKLIALFLVFSMLFSLCSCANKNNGSDNGNDKDENAGQGEVINKLPTVAVPEYKDYGRGTVNFEKLIYARPDLQTIIDAFNAVTLTVTANEKTVEDQIEDIRALEDDLDNVRTMYTLSEIYHNKDTSEKYWQTEYPPFRVRYQTTE